MLDSQFSSNSVSPFPVEVYTTADLPLYNMYDHIITVTYP